MRKTITGGPTNGSWTKLLSVGAAGGLSTIDTGSISRFYNASTRNISRLYTLHCGYGLYSQAFRGSILRVQAVLIIGVQYCSYSQYSQYMGFQYCSYSQYSQYLDFQYCSYSQYSQYLGFQYCSLPVLAVFRPPVLQYSLLGVRNVVLDTYILK